MVIEKGPGVNAGPFFMKIVIPYKDFNGPELRYTLRGIELFIEDPEITIIGDLPAWVKNVDHIPYNDNPELRFKERNIFEKLLLYNHDFLFFNDDHFLLEPFSKSTYHYSGMLSENILQPGNHFRATIKNTLDCFGEIKNYFRHSPLFIERGKLEIIRDLDWNKEWGYCIKSIYAFLHSIEGEDYPDLKIRTHHTYAAIKKLIEYRPYFSTGNYAINSDMIKVLEELYPKKSIYE